MRTHIRPITLTTPLTEKPQNAEPATPVSARPLNPVVATGQCLWFLFLLPVLLITTLFLSRSTASDDLPQSLDDQWE